MKQHTAPCKGCPFRKDIEPGALGGSPIEVYVGQVNLPSWLPCHQDKNYAEKASHPSEVSSCAGAAILRSNEGIRVPSTLLYLPADHPSVFTSLAHFVAHHTGKTVAEARANVDGRFRAYLHVEGVARRAGQTLPDTEMKTHRTKRRSSVRCRSGLMGWRTRLRNIHIDFKEFKLWDGLYALAQRLGYRDASEAWKANPVIEGSVNPSDYRKVKP